MLHLKSDTLISYDSYVSRGIESVTKASSRQDRQKRSQPLKVILRGYEPSADKVLNLLVSTPVPSHLQSAPPVGMGWEGTSISLIEVNSNVLYPLINSGRSHIRKTASFTRYRKIYLKPYSSLSWLIKQCPPRFLSRIRLHLDIAKRKAHMGIVMT